MAAPVASRRTLRIRQVSAKVNLSPATIWRLTASGKFPKPIKISVGCTAWFDHEIDEMLDAIAAERECGIGNEPASCGDVARGNQNGGLVPAKQAPHTEKSATAYCHGDAGTSKSQRKCAAYIPSRTRGAT